MTAPRRASREMVMSALHHQHMMGHPGIIELADLQALLPANTQGVWDTLLGLAEYDLVDVIPKDRVFGRPARAFLTERGQRWEPQEWEGDQYVWEKKPTEYVFRNLGTTGLGTLLGYAHTWRHAYYAGEEPPEPTVFTWRNREGYYVHVDKLTGGPDEVHHRFWVAGESYRLTLDGRA